MMHYKKGENVEEEISKKDIPFDDCLPEGHGDFLWMQVKGGTKVDNVVSYARNALDTQQHRTMVWTGCGGGIVKTISCVEILKRSYPLYQVTRMCYSTITERWVPEKEGLEQIIVTRKIPCIHILISLEPLSDVIEGLQTPNSKIPFGSKGKHPPSHSNVNRGKRRRPTAQRNDK